MFHVHWFYWFHSFSSSNPTAQRGPGLRHSRGFQITQWQATIGRTPLDGWSARRRDLYLTARKSEETDIHAQGAIPPPPPQIFSFSLFVVCSYLFLCLLYPGLCLLPFPYIHNTTIYNPSGIRTNKASKSMAADPHLRPLCHWNELVVSLAKRTREQAKYYVKCNVGSVTEPHHEPVF